MALLRIALFVVCAIASSSVQAQRFALPLDVEQGLVFGEAAPRTPYLFGVRLAPSLDVERARFGLTLAPLYRNPKWDFALGANMSLFVPLAGRDIGVRFAVQGEYLPVERAARASVGVVFELLGLLRVGLWPAFDFAATRAELCLGVGGDIVRWAEALSDDW
jgi:hypothetical protein